MDDLDELCAHLVRTTGLAPAEASRVVREVMAHLVTETPEAYAVRRHRELKERGMLRNEAIYRQIAEEMEARPFAAPRLSERQIRRIIYG